MFGVRNFLVAIGLVPVSSSGIDSKGEMESLASNGKLNYHNGTSASPVVTEAHTATLTNKTISASSNTISNLANANLSGSAGITNANLAVMANNTVKGNISGPSATPSDVPISSIISAGGAITSLTGSVLASGPGAAAATIPLTSAHILVGNGSNLATDVAMSGDVHIANTGATTIQPLAVDDTKISSGAATTGTVLTADGSGNTSWITPGAAALPPGVMLPYGGSSLPAGFLFCTGGGVSTTVYSALFAAIGYSFGGSGTTFFLPNMQRSVPMGAGGSGSATIGNTVGSIGGEENHALTTGELASHNHTINDSGHSHVTPLQTGGSGFNNAPNGATGGGPQTISNASTSVNTTGITINTAGSGTAHNTIQPSVVFNFIIKT